MTLLPIALLLRSACVAATAAAGTAAPAAGGGAEPRTPLVVIHVEANVDGASGGHTALRIGSFVYHFQQSDGALLRLVRDEWTGFRHVYAGLENRTLHLAQLDVGEADVERVAATFSRAFVEQELEFERAARLRDDARWLDALRDRRDPPPLRETGFFAAAPDADATAARAEDDGAAMLAASVADACGANFLGEERARVDAALATFRLAPASTDLEPWRELLARREALRVLDERAPLAAAAVIDDVDPRPLNDAERRGLASVRDAEGTAIVALLRSRRPDRGFALLVATARHRAACRSLARGRLVTLDPYPDDATVGAPDPSSAAEAAQAQQHLKRRALAAVHEIRAAVLGAEPFRYDEARFNALEDVVARCREARRGARGEPVRLHEGRMVPSRGRALAVTLPVDDVASRAALAAARADATDRELRGQRRYSLIDHNCVTEIARLLDASFPDPADVARALGARLEPGDAFGFVPFVFQRQVLARLRVLREETLLNHRQEALAQVERAQPGVLTDLREATTLTSTIYTPRASDGAFLFFTDDVTWQRPLRGLANVGYGVGDGLFGLLTAPFDRGRRVRTGFHGAFFSLPELVFANVRKGSFGEVDEPPRGE